MATNDDLSGSQQIIKRRKVGSYQNSMATFSQLPLEAREAIATYLPYRDILALCNVEKGLIEICNDPDFWRGLVRQRFPSYQGNPYTNQDPKGLFRRLETMYQVTIIPYHGEKISFMTGKQSILAAAIIAVRISSPFFIHEHLDIYKPGTGDQLSWIEMSTIENRYKPVIQNLEGILKIHPNTFVVEIKYTFDNVEKRMYLINTNKEMIDFLVKIMSSFDTKNISITNI